jgi:thiamine pyrophosphokinase
VENSRRVLGVLAGGDIDRDVLRLWTDTADCIIAADAGADILNEAGIEPQLIIGDMDSVSPHVLESIPNQLRISDQDTTDCDKLLAQVQKEGHAAVTLAGIEGDRPDHVLAILHSAARSSLDVRLAYRRGVGWIVDAGHSRRIQTRPGRRASLLAIEPCHGVYLSGVMWPLENARLSLLGGTSISNRTEAEDISVTVTEGAALLFLEVPKEELPVW